MTKTTDLLVDIAHEKNGYKVGEPWRFNELSLVAIVPICRETAQERSYRLFTEMGAGLGITDTGNIDKMQVVNNSEFPVLFKTGDIFTGATQERTVTLSQVVLPGEKTIVDCACVYSTKGIRSGQRVGYGGHVPTKVRRTVYSSRGRKSSRGPARMPWVPEGPYNRNEHPLADSFYEQGMQQRIWSSVSSYAKEAADSHSHYVNFMASAGPEGRREVVDLSTEEVNQTWHKTKDDLKGRLEETEKKFKSAIKSIPKIENQVGMMLAGWQGFDSLDLFNHPDAWEAVRSAILKAEASDISRTSNDDLFQFRPEKALDLLNQLLQNSYVEEPAIKNSRSETILLSSGKLLGEVVILDEEPIHFSLTEKES